MLIKLGAEDSSIPGFLVIYDTHKFVKGFESKMIQSNLTQKIKITLHKNEVFHYEFLYFLY